MKLQIMNDLYKLFTKENINGIDSIMHMAFATVLVKLNRDLESDKFNISVDVKKNLATLTVEHFETIKRELQTMYNIMDFNFDINFDKVINYLKTIIGNKTINVNTNILNDIFMTHLNNDKKIHIKTYATFYQNPLLTEFIATIIPPNFNVNSLDDKIFEGNIKINSYQSYVAKQIKLKHPNFNFDLNKFISSQNNNQIKSLINYDFMTIHNKNTFSNIISGNILAENIKINNQVEMFDIIVFNVDSDIHNLIHAKCCDEIKKIRIRGTSYEALTMQLIMMKLNKNGRCAVIISDSFLFSDSNQLIETRKYLLENYNLKKVVHLDETLYHYKGAMNSLCYFENNGQTENIFFSDLKNYSTRLEEQNSISVSYEDIKKNNYSLYNKLYRNILRQNASASTASQNSSKSNELKYIKLKEVFDFKTTDSDSNSNSISDISGSDTVIGCAKYYKNTDSIELILKDTKLNLSDYDYYFIEKRNDNFIQNFLSYYLMYVLKNHIDLYTKGKTSQLDLDKILSIDIPLITKSMQNTINNYYLYSTNLYKLNKEKIKTYQNLKEDILTSFNKTNIIEINKIVDIIAHDDTALIKNILNTNSNSNTKTISIIRNGSSAGNINLHQESLKYIVSNNLILTNSYYLNNKHSSYITDYIYQYLLFEKYKLKELAYLTKQPNLTKSNIASLSVPDNSLEVQKKVIEYCSEIDLDIEKISLENTKIKEKDIMSIILSIV